MELGGLLVGIPGLVGLLISTSLRGYEIFAHARDLNEDVRYYHNLFCLEEQKLKDLEKRLAEFAAGRQLAEVLDSDRYLLIVRTTAEIAQLFASIDGVECAYGLRIESGPPSVTRASVPTIQLTSASDTGGGGKRGRFSLSRTIRRLSNPSPSKPRATDPLARKSGNEGERPSLRLSVRETPLCSVISDATIVEEIQSLATGFDRKISSFKQCKWAVSDKERFRNLIHQLKEYNEGLSKITEPLFLSTGKSSLDIKSFDEFEMQTELPFLRNHYFSGREDLIDRIHEIFHPADAASPTSPARGLVALHGLGGVGKTQIALEYAHRHERTYSTILWVDARDPTVLMTSGTRIVQQIVRHYFAGYPTNRESHLRIANELGIPGDIDSSGNIQQKLVLDSERVWQVIKRWLQKKGNVRWLLLVDNHDDLDAVKIDEYLPTCDWGKIIITSRRPGIQALGCSLAVTEMEKEPGLAMLLKAMPTGGDYWTTEELKAAEKVVEKLGGLPLAISQAAAYISAAQIDFEEYLQRLEANFKRTASKKPGVWSYGNDTVFTCWEMSFQALCPSAVRLLHICAFLSNEDIPDVLFRCGSGSLDWLKNDNNAFDNAIEDLLAFSLVKRKAASPAKRRGTAKRDSFWIHPLVHQWAREHVGVAEQKVTATEAISLITAILRSRREDRTPEYWDFERRISNHIDQCSQLIAKHYPNDGTPCPKSISLALHTLGRVELQRGYYQKSVETIRQATAGLSGFQALDAMGDLGGALANLGRMTEAQTWLQRALDGKEKLLGKDHPSTLNAVQGMGVVVHHLQGGGKSLEWFQRALEGLEKALGNDHSDTLNAAHWIAHSFESMGADDKALEWHRRVLDGQEKTLGNVHPSTLETIDCIGGAFVRKKDYQKAFQSYEQALAGKMKTLGKDHHSTLKTIFGLGAASEKQGEYDKAFEWYQQALDGSEKVLGKDHADTRLTRYCVAGLLKFRGEYEKALECYQQVLESQEKETGKDHVDTLATVHSVARVLEIQGEYKKALQYYQRALDGSQKLPNADNRLRVTSAEGVARIEAFLAMSRPLTEPSTVES